MTHVAIGMQGRQPTSTVFVELVALVLVRVMPDVHADRNLLVGAVRRSGNPEGLQRKQYQEEDGEPAAHCTRIVSGRSAARRWKGNAQEL